MKMEMKRIVGSIVLLACTMALAAQVKVTAEIDSMQLLIGEQAHVRLSATMKKGQQAVFPQYQYTEHLTPGVEVINMSDIDTADVNNGMVRLSRTYTITSFDDTLYYLPPMKVMVDGKEYASKNLALKVLTIDVDTLHPNQFFPPKDVQNNPFLWDEWKLPFVLSVLVVLLTILVYYLYIRLRDNKPIIAKIRIIRKMLPHQKAMMEIERIKSERMDTSENQKLYYTRLTDALRTYMEERFGFQAMEMTSGEIIEHLKKEEDQTKVRELTELLETADLVKFAKHSAMLNERDRDMASVVEFIQTTKKEDMPTIEKVKPTLSESDRRTRRSRAIIISLITIASAAAIAALIYVVWTVFMMIS